MYRAMLVDNERWVLMDIVQTFPWEEHGFEVVGQTTDALSAISLAKECRPDVAFLDIRMPDLSGLDLIPLLAQSHPDLLFVLITGHSEFQYARRAIQLGVFDYCLKPVEPDYASELLERLGECLTELRDKPPAIPEGEEVSNDQFALVLQYVKDHMYEKLTLEEVAEKHFMNSNYCGYLFKLTTGKTFSQYVREVKINMACYLLGHTNLRINDIADRIGYGNSNYFTRVFTSSQGISPREYRSQCQQEG